LATKKLKQIYNLHKTEGATHKRNNHILDKIKHKLTTNNAIIAQEDKGKTLVIIYQQDYNEKLYNFINESNIQQIPRNPIYKDTRTIGDTIQQCNLIFHKNQINTLYKETLNHQN
jgi:hypothetical protein